MKFINLKTRAEEAIISCPSVLCLGNFDGVHIGHRQLVASVQSRCKLLKAYFPTVVSGAWLFDSTDYKSCEEIYTMAEKLNVFASLGLDYAIIADFDEMRSMPPNVFVKEVLVEECKCVHAVCGENFRFGSHAAGDSELLVNLMNGNATVVPLCSESGDIVSSTLIRRLLERGDVERANLLLSEHYSITERVIHGKALGRRIGIPTINQIATGKELILKNGIYATLCTVDDRKYYGVTNIGFRPTVESTELKNVETFIIDFDGDCYDKPVRVEFLFRIRDEMRFDSIDELCDRINKDILTVKDHFNI